MDVAARKSGITAKRHDRTKAPSLTKVRAQALIKHECIEYEPESYKSLGLALDHHGLGLYNSPWVHSEISPEEARLSLLKKDTITCILRHNHGHSRRHKCLYPRGSFLAGRHDASTACRLCPTYQGKAALHHGSGKWRREMPSFTLPYSSGRMIGYSSQRA